MWIQCTAVFVLVLCVLKSDACSDGQVYTAKEKNGKIAISCAPAGFCAIPEIEPMGTTENGGKGKFATKVGKKDGKVVVEEWSEYALPPPDKHIEICRTLAVEDSGVAIEFKEDGTGKKYKFVEEEPEEPHGEAQLMEEPSNSWLVKTIKSTKKGIKVKVCQIVCHTDYSYGSENVAAGCFSSEEVVETLTGPVKMEHLQAGDKVMVYNTKLNVYSYEAVKYFLHREPALLANFVILKTKSGKTVSLTPDHLLPIVDCDQVYNSSLEGTRQLYSNSMKPASMAKVGLCVMVMDQIQQLGLDEIVTIESKLQHGIYAPLTQSGTVMVNGVHASCFVELGNFDLLISSLQTIQAFTGALADLWKPTSLTDLHSANGELSYFYKLALQIDKIIMP